MPLIVIEADLSPAPRFLAGALVDQLDLVAAALRPAAVHAKQHLGPVLGLRTAGAGVYLQVAVVGIGLAGEKRLELLLACACLQGVEQALRLIQARRVFLAFRQLGQGNAVGELFLQLAVTAQSLFQMIALAHHPLGARTILPQSGILRLRVQLIEAKCALVEVKDASSAGRETAQSPRPPLGFPLAWWFLAEQWAR
jgi:hypothetical protein